METTLKLWIAEMLLRGVNILVYLAIRQEEDSPTKTAHQDYVREMSILIRHVQDKQKTEEGREVYG